MPMSNMVGIKDVHMLTVYNTMGISMGEKGIPTSMSMNMNIMVKNVITITARKHSLNK